MWVELVENQDVTTLAVEVVVGMAEVLDIDLVLVEVLLTTWKLLLVRQVVLTLAMDVLSLISIAHLRQCHQ